MQTRTYPPEIVDQIVSGRYCFSALGEPRIYRQITERKTRAPGADSEDAQRARTRAWQTLTASQRALIASHGVDSTHGGDRVSADHVYYRFRGTVGYRARQNRCSVRLVKMAIELRKIEGKRSPLIRAVASGTIGLGDALAHVDRSERELRKAIKLVEQHKARSLRQAFAH
jgi:hypothetical protein